MSTTPRTDKAEIVGAGGAPYCLSSFARQLETELTQAKQSITELLERLQDRTHSHSLASMRDVQTIQRQAVEIDALKDKIKVLSSGADKS